MSPLPLARPSNPDTGISDTLDDLTALRRYAKTGDPRAFELVTARYEAMVLATCRRVLRNHADAEDAAQQAFMKLASHASRVQSNAAAWLHACAMRTATDIARAASSRRRAESRAADESAATAGAPDESTTPAEWAELESQLDAALAKLDPADRDLICARFLAGRSQADLAREAAVNPGTLHRRLNKALDKLRAHLYETGVSVTAAALTGGLAAIHAASPAPGVALNATLAKIGLAGMPGAKAPLVSTVSAKTVVVAVAGLALTVGMIAGGAMIVNGTSGIGGGLAFAGAPSTAPERPKRKTRPHRLVALTDPTWLGATAIVTGDTLQFSMPDFAEDQQTIVHYGMTLEVDGLARTEPKPGKAITLDARLTQRDFPPDMLPFNTVGAEFPIDLELDRLGRARFRAGFKSDEGERELVFVAARPAFADPAEFPVPDRAMTFEGAWFETRDWQLTIDANDIMIAEGTWNIHRLRIIDWQDAGDHARIQAIAADSMDPRLVGKRVKLLLKQEGDTYTLAYHYHAGPMLNDWPKGFEPGEQRNIQVLKFSKGKP